MRQLSLILLLAAATLVLGLASGCRRTEYICSAYQSAFFVDKNYANEFYHAKVDADSQPVVNRVKKNQYLLIKPISASRKEKGWKVVPMITVFPPSLTDSTAGDSTQGVPNAGGNYEGDGIEKTNFLDIPGESPRQKRRREKREAKERERANKEAEKRNGQPKEEDAPKQPDPEKPF